MKKLIAALALAALPFTAQAAVRSAVQFPLAIDYDLDATSFVYPASQGMPRASFGPGSRVEGVLGTIKSNVKVSAAASTTLAATVASTEPFAALQVGDLIRVRVTGLPGVPDQINALEASDAPWLKVVAKASANSITVNQSLTATAVGFEWRRASVGTQVGYGWVPVRGFDKVKFTVWFAGTTDTAGFNSRVECRDDVPGIDTGSFKVVAPSHTGATASAECGAGAIAAADQSCTTSDAVVTAGLGRVSYTIDSSPWAECRVGIRINTADDGADAVPETIRVEFTGVTID